MRQLIEFRLREFLTNYEHIWHMKIMDRSVREILEKKDTMSDRAILDLYEVVLREVWGI